MFLAKFDLSLEPSFETCESGLNCLKVDEFAPRLCFLYKTMDLWHVSKLFYQATSQSYEVLSQNPVHFSSTLQAFIWCHFSPSGLSQYLMQTSLEFKLLQIFLQNFTGMFVFTSNLIFWHYKAKWKETVFPYGGTQANGPIILKFLSPL